MFKKLLTGSLLAAAALLVAAPAASAATEAPASSGTHLSQTTASVASPDSDCRPPASACSTAVH